MKLHLHWTLLVVAGCSAGGGGFDRGGTSDPNDPLGGGSMFNPGSGSGDMFVEDLPLINCTANCQDFPADPIFFSDDNTPAPPSNAPDLSGAADNFGSTGACVREPQLSEEGTGRPGALFPANWLEPRFRWQPLAGEDLWEIRLSADLEVNDLVVYTRATTWIMPKEIWQAVANNVHMQPIVVTIRGVNSSSPGTPSGTRGSFQIAPVNAGGSMVYWATTSSDVTPDTSRLYGFSVGEDNVVEALAVPEVQLSGILAEGGRDLRGMYTDPKGVQPGHVQCIGCHVSTPDGAAVAFTDHWPWNSVFASVEEATVGQTPS
jgi:hypothetical protein